jgi:hypothetical protein
MRFIFAIFFTCACSSPSPSSDAGVDAQTDATNDAAIDADAGACVVQTCNGTFSLYLGQTIPYGDTCNAESCSWKGGGGLTTCGCTFIVDCPCPDAGTD